MRSSLAVLAVCATLAACAPTEAASDAASNAMDASSDAALVLDVGPSCGPCTSDEQCAASCHFPDGIACCDFASGNRCYLSHTLWCPDQRVDSGVDAASDAACQQGDDAARIDVVAPGLPGAILTITDPDTHVVQSTTLDASGHGTLDSGALVVSVGGMLAHTAAGGSPVSIDVAVGAVDTTLSVASVFPTAPVASYVNDVHLFLGRDAATGECVASAREVVGNCTWYASTDAAPTLDTQPCGPFR